MKRLATVFVFSFFGDSLFSQVVQNYSEYNTKPGSYFIRTVDQARVADNKFWMVGAGLMLATVYDIETTHRSLNNCFDCRESNPVARLLISRNRPVAYASAIGINAAVMYVTYRIKKGGHKSWWIYPTVVIAVHTAAGSSNLRFVK